MTQQKATTINLTYNPDTGEFKRPSGKIAGWTDQDGYKRVKINGITYYCHRLAFYLVNGIWPDDEIDHKNGVKGDNRWVNLREATSSGNVANKPGSSSTGYKGVYKHGNKFKAAIKKDGKIKYLGIHNTAKLAAKVYDLAATELHGEFAYLNFRSD